jgi:pimeloyl-ACP methyl ester carboxylesterase
MIDLLLVPGLACTGQMWVKQIEALSEVATCRVADLSSEETIAAMAAAITRDAPERFALAGFSMGGLVALEILARFPERVSHLALLSTNAAGILPQVREKLTKAIDLVGQQGLETYLRGAFPTYFAPSHLEDAALWESFRTMGLTLGPAATVRQMRALLEYPGTPKDLLKGIRCPVTLICGREDQRTPPAVHTAMAAEIPDARLHILNDAGHFTPLEAPGGVSAALIRWLQN